MIVTAVLTAALGAAGAAPVLTLEEALREAETRNLDLQVARARLEQARTGVQKAWSAYLPQLSVGGSYTRNNTEAEIALPSGYYIRDVFQPQGPRFDPAQEPSLENPPGAQTSLILVPSELTEVTIQKRNQLGAQARLSQAVIVPALWPAIRAAYLGQEYAELSTENARREILFAVAQLYYGAAAVREGIAVQERQLELNRKREADARVRVELGSSPRVAQLRAEIDRARSEQDLKRSINAYRAQIVALGTLLSRPPTFDVVRPEEPKMPEDIAALPERALKERVDLAAAQKSVSLAKAQAEATTFKFLPTVGFLAQYQIANVGGFTGDASTWFLQLGVSWTLWDSGLREAEMREAYHRVREAELSAQKLVEGTAGEIERARLELESAIANREKAKELVVLAKENLSLVDASFQAGAATYLEVADASNNLLAAETNMVAESLNANLAELRLLRAAGLFVKTP